MSQIKLFDNYVNGIDEYTKLLLHFDGTDGAQAYTAETGQTVTFAGTAQLDTAEKKFGASSLLLDGNSDYVTLPASSDWYFGTEDFTIDFQYRPNVLAVYAPLFFVHQDSKNYIRIDTADSGVDLRILLVVGGTSLINSTTSSVFSQGAFHHVGVVRNGNNLTAYINGTSVAVIDVTGITFPNIPAPLKIGVDATNTRFVNGHIDEFRVSKGIARWTENFTPPTRAYAKDIKKINTLENYFRDKYTKLLLKFNGSDGATTYTAETGQTVTFVGTAQLDTAEKRFGASSLLLDGNSDYVTVPDSDDWNFGAGDFTIDCWVRLHSIQTNNQFYMQQTTNNDNRIIFYYNNDTKQFIFYVRSSAKHLALYSYNTTISTNTWYHLALVRNGENMYLFIDGNLKTWSVITTPISTNVIPNYTGALVIGSAIALTFLDGQFDGYRITKGTALWTENFTPPVDIAKINGITV